MLSLAEAFTPIQLFLFDVGCKLAHDSLQMLVKVRGKLLVRKIEVFHVFRLLCEPRAVHSS